MANDDKADGLWLTNAELAELLRAAEHQIAGDKICHMDTPRALKTATAKLQKVVDGPSGR